MTRLTIDISGAEKQQIKTLAALHGQTLKDYVLERVLPSDEVAEIGALLLQSVTENKYSEWTPEKMQDIRQSLRD
ncbi:MAG: antitoxin [bacterium]|nr:antitoxin [bacterium]